MIQKFMQVSLVIKGFAEEIDLEKYHDVYDISDFDISDAMQGFSEQEFDDLESLRCLKIAASRFHTIRKLLLCSLLAFEATGDNTDFLRWSTAAEGLRTLNEITTRSFERIRQILADEESKATILSASYTWSLTLQRSLSSRTQKYRYLPEARSGGLNSSSSTRYPRASEASKQSLLCCGRSRRRL